MEGVCMCILFYIYNKKMQFTKYIHINVAHTLMSLRCTLTRNVILKKKVFKCV